MENGCKYCTNDKKIKKRGLRETMGVNKRKGSEQFAERFKKLLENTDKDELCRKLDITGETAFRQWSNGYTLPTADKLPILAEHFHCTTDYLLGLRQFDDDELMSLGNRIADLRKSKGWTQEVLADKLNIARNTLAKIEGGFRDVKTTELISIAKVLDVSVDYLLGLSPQTDMGFQDRIKHLRLESGLSHCELAALVGKSEGASRSWEAGRSSPDFDTLIQLSKHFGCTTDYMLGLTSVKRADDVVMRDTSDRYGLTETALTELSRTKPYVRVINLLLSEERGKKILKVLSHYLFTTFDNAYAPELLGEQLAEETVRNAMLLCALNELHDMRI